MPGRSADPTGKSATCEVAPVERTAQRGAPVAACVVEPTEAFCIPGVDPQRPGIRGLPNERDETADSVTDAVAAAAPRNALPTSSGGPASATDNAGDGEDGDDDGYVIIGTLPPDEAASLSALLARLSTCGGAQLFIAGLT